MEIVREYLDRILPLSDCEWYDFEKCLSKEYVGSRSFILKEAQVCDYLAFIESGMFRQYVREDGEEKISSFFFSGEFVTNYRSFLTGQPSKLYIESMQDSVYYKIFKSDLIGLYDRHRNFERIGRLIAERLYLNVAERLDGFLIASPRQRYEDLVKRNSKLLQSIPSYMIASYLGIKPETLSRIRAKIK